MPRTYYRGTGQRLPVPADGRRIRYYQPQFYDPFFFIQGSIPEKMVMRELVRRGIWFEHTPQTNPINWGWLKSVASSDPSKWEADFLFPQYKIWLEVQGAYFHSLPGVPEKEALRFAIIEKAGWRPIYWWDYDIETRLPDLMNAVPEFYRPSDPVPQGTGFWEALPVDPNEYPWNRPGPGKQGAPRTWGSHLNHPGLAYNQKYKGIRNKGQYRGLPFFEGGDGIDHLKGLRTANSNRAQTPQYISRTRKNYTRRPKIRKRWSHG